MKGTECRRAGSGQEIIPVFQMCSGSEMAAGRPPRGGRRRCTMAAVQGQSLGAPGLLFSLLVGWCGVPVSIQ